MTLAAFQRARRKVVNRIVPYKCILGDATGQVYAAESGYYWVRRFDRADANGNVTPGTPFRVRSGTALVVPRGGRQVWVGTGLDGHLTCLGFVHEDLVAPGVGMDPRAAQPNDPYRAWIRLKQIQNFRALPLATGSTDSMKVQVRQLFYYTEEGDVVRYNGTNASTHIDLTAYVPAAALQRYVVLWLRTYNPNALADIQVTYSSTISSVDDVLSFDELQECADAADADTIPIQAFRLANAQTTLTLDDTIDLDLRQFMNMPQVYGFPNVVPRSYRVHEDHSVIMPEVVTISAGGGIQIQAGGVLVILDTDPAEEGGGGGSGMSSFTVAGDSGTPQTIENGNTLTIAGGTGLSSAAGATDTVTINLDTPVSIANGGTGQTNASDAFDALAPTTTDGDIIYHNGSSNTRLPIGTSGELSVSGTTPVWRNTFPEYYLTGFKLHRQSNSVLMVERGAARTFDGTLVQVYPSNFGLLDMADNADWIGGATAEAASEVVWIYMHPSNQNVYLHNKAPNSSFGSHDATVLVNQAGWNGTAANGLNATSVTFDGGSIPSYVNSGGYLALIYASTDTDYSVGRGRGSGAAGSRNNVSAAYITAVSGSTITLEAGHNIAINDNDRIAICEYGALRYRDESGTIYAFVNAMYNDGSSNLDSSRTAYLSKYIANEGADATTSSGTFADVASYFNLPILTTGGDVEFCLSASISHSATNGFIYFDMNVDSLTVYGNDGAAFTILGNAATAVEIDFKRVIRNLLPGTHTFAPQWKRVTAGTATLYAGAGTANRDTHSEFMVREVGH